MHAGSVFRNLLNLEGILQMHRFKSPHAKEPQPWMVLRKSAGLVERLRLCNAYLGCFSLQSKFEYLSLSLSLSIDRSIYLIYSILFYSS